MDCCGVQLCPFTMSMAGPGPPSPAVPRPQGGPQLATDTVNGHSWTPTEPQLNRQSHMLAQLGTDGAAVRGEGSRTQPRWGQSHNPRRPRLLAQGRRRATYTPLPRWAGMSEGSSPQVRCAGRRRVVASLGTVGTLSSQGGSALLSFWAEPGLCGHSTRPRAVPVPCKSW